MIRGLPRDLGARRMSVAGMRPADESAVVDVHVHFHWKPKPRLEYYASQTRKLPSTRKLPFTLEKFFRNYFSGAKLSLNLRIAKVAAVDCFIEIYNLYNNWNQIFLNLKWLIKFKIKNLFIFFLFWFSIGDFYAFCWNLLNLLIAVFIALTH